MERRDLLIGGVVLFVTAASWAASLAYDAGQREVASYNAGQEWAQDNQPSYAECEEQMFRVMGPKVNGNSWLQGCVSSPGGGPPLISPSPAAPPS
jgi:hypothetical protein